MIMLTTTLGLGFETTIVMVGVREEVKVEEDEGMRDIAFV